MARTRLHRLATGSRALVRAQRRRRARPEPPGREALERLADLLAPVAAETRLIDVPADRPPWQPTGLRLEQGDAVTTFAAGRAYLSRVLDLWVGPPFQLWFRVGGAPIFRGTRASHGFTASAAGELELASHFPGDWADPSGALATSPRDYRRMSGGMAVLAARWPRGADVDAALAELASADESGLVAGELDRRANAAPEPEGWRHLWSLGRSEVYRAEADGIACHACGDTAILRRDVDVPLTDATRLRWSWRVDELPSELAEDTLLTHDYLSIALEFDNGQDLTWQWSAELPPGYGYRCPIPTWRERETHLVIRSGRGDLGRWVSEEVAVRRDYERAVGPAPARIVAIWLIAVTTFQHGAGRCAYRAIELG